MKNKLLELSHKYKTPLYVYDGNKIIEQYNSFVESFHVKKLKLHFAAKALTNISILRLIKELGGGLDCVSIEEIELGLKAGFNPEEIIFTPNGICFDEYKKAINIGTKITIDNLSVLEKIGLNSNETPIFLRFNPHVMAGGNRNISVGHIDSKFGISMHQLPITKRIVDKYNINVEGIHIHTGSDIVELDIFERVANLIFSIADQFENIKSIDFGSGFKIKYKNDDLETNISSIGKKFSVLFNKYCEKRKKDLILRFEPGKFLVSESGSFLSKVNVVKQTTSCTFASIDSGFNHFVRPMFYNSYHKIINISNPKGQNKMYSVVGYICESDTFAEDRIIREIREEDILLFENAGAYCFSMASNYNSRLKPAEVLLLNGKEYLIRKRETIQDLLNNQEIPEIDKWV
jgi:diaminopimelate decarboxylase